jgi:hypothetical protein
MSVFLNFYDDLFEKMEIFSYRRNKVTTLTSSKALPVELKNYADDLPSIYIHFSPLFGTFNPSINLSSFHAHNALRTFPRDTLAKALTIFVLPSINGKDLHLQ